MYMRIATINLYSLLKLNKYPTSTPQTRLTGNKTTTSFLRIKEFQSIWRTPWETSHLCYEDNLNHEFTLLVKLWDTRESQNILSWKGPIIIIQLQALHKHPKIPPCATPGAPAPSGLSPFPGKPGQCPNTLGWGEEKPFPKPHPWPSSSPSLSRRPTRLQPSTSNTALTPKPPTPDPPRRLRTARRG